MPTIDDEIRAALAAPPPPSIDDEIRKALHPPGPAERAQISSDQIDREIRDTLRAAGQPIRTAPLQGFTAGLDRGWTIQDTHGLASYGIQPDPDLNPYRRNQFIQSIHDQLRAGEQLPGILNQTNPRDPMYGVLNDDVGDPQKGPIWNNKIAAWAGTLYNLRHQRASSAEMHQAVADALERWVTGAVKAEPRNVADIPTAQLGTVAAGGPAPPQPWTKVNFALPQGTTVADLQELYTKYTGTGKDFFTPEDTQLFDAIHGDDAFKFVRSRMPYFVTRGRLEKMLGHQIEDRNRPVPTNIDQSDPSTDEVTQTPPGFPIRLEHIAEKDPDLQFLTQISQAKLQAKAEGERFAATRTVPTQIYMPGYRAGQWSLGTAFKDLARLAFPNTVLDPGGEGPPPLEVSMQTAIESPKVSTQLAEAGIMAPFAGFAVSYPVRAALFYYGLPAATSAVLGVADYSTSLFTHQEGLVTAGIAKSLGYLTRAIAPHLSEDARNDAAFAGRVIDMHPAGTTAETIQDTLRLIPSAAAFNQIIEAVSKGDSLAGTFARGVMDNPFLEESLGGIVGATDRPAEFAALALGFTAIPGYLFSKLPLKGVRTPQTGFMGRDLRYSNYDYTSATGQAAEVARGALVKLVDKYTRTLRRPADVGPYLDRVTDMLKAEGGGISAADAGALLTKIEKIRKDSEAMGTAKIRQETREALFDVGRRSVDIGPTEALYTVLGEGVVLGAPESARIYAKRLAALDKIKQGGPADPILNITEDQRYIDAMVRAVHEKIDADQLAVNRKHNALTMTADAADKITARGEARDQQVQASIVEQEQIVRKTNDEVQQALYNTAHYDSFGGIRYKPGKFPQDPVEEITVEKNTTQKRADLRQRISDKLEAARAEGKIIHLDKAELDALNETRNYPLDLRFAQRSHDALAKDIKLHKDAIKGDTEDVNRLNAFSQRVQAIDPSEPGRRIEVPNAVKTVLEREFSQKAFEITAEKLYSIHPGYSHQALNHMEALDELIGKTRGDLVDASSTLRRLSEFHSKILFNSGKRGDWVWALQRNMRDGADYEKFILLQGMRAAKLLGLSEDVPIEQVMQALYDATQGKGSSPLAIGMMREIREYLGKGLIDTGMADRATVQKWIEDPTYYHGVLDPEDISRLPPAVHHPIGRWTRLDVRGDYMKAAIPETEGEYHVAYKEGGQLKFKEGFKSPAEAKAWLDSGAGGLDPSTPVDIRKNLPFAEKVLRGIFGDPNISFLSLVQKMARDISHARLAMDLARTPFVRSQAEAEMAGMRIAENVAQDPKGGTWYHVTDPKALHLTDKWVHEKVLEYLHLHDVGFEWMKEMSTGIQSGTGLWDFLKIFKGGNPLMNYSQEVMTKLLRTDNKPGWLTQLIKVPSNLLAFSRVATSVASWINQWPANLLYNMPTAGLETLHAGNWNFILKAAGEYLDHLQTPTNPRALELERNGNYQHSKIAFYDELKALINRYREDPAQLTGRMEFHRGRASYLELRGDINGAAAHREKAWNLEQQLQNLEPKSAGGFMRDVAGLGWKVVKEVSQAALEGKGKLNDTLWNFFALPDNIAKFATHKYLVEVKGLSVADSLSRVDAFMQNLHRTPQAIKGLNQRIGGGLFLSYRWNAYSTALNAVMKRPLFVASRLGLTAAWNSLMLQMGGQDSEDAINRWSYINYGVPANPVTKAQYLTQRILFPGGYGGISLGNTFFDVFSARSQLGRNYAALIQKQDEPFYSKASKLILNGVLSQFIGSLPAANIGANLIKGTDDQGRPFQNPFVDPFISTMKQFIPATAQDAYEIGARKLGYRWDRYSGEQRLWSDYVVKRLGGLDPNELTDENVLRAAIQFQVRRSRDPGKWISEDNSDKIGTLIRAAGATGNDAESLKQRVQIAKDYIASKDRANDYGGTVVPKALTIEQLENALKTGMTIGAFSDFHRLSLPEQLGVYSNLRLYAPHVRNAALDGQLKTIMFDRAQSPAVHGESEADLQHAVLAINENPALPKSTKDFLIQMANDALARIEKDPGRKRK